MDLIIRTFHGCSEKIARISLTAFFALLILFTTNAAFAQQSELAPSAPPETFTYQGKLNLSGLPVSGQYDFSFVFFDAVTGGTQITEFEALDQTVTNGIFTTLITTVGLYANLDPKWIEISVRPAASGPYTTLSPRQALTESPIAGKARSADVANSAVTATNAVTAANATNANFATSANSANSATFSTSSGSSNDSANLGGVGASNYLLNNGNGSMLTNLTGTFKWNVISSSQQSQSNFGYVTDSTSEVVVNLPTSPAVGDVIRVAGAGSGGWRVSQNSGQLIRSDLSLNGAWTPRESARDWTTVAASANGVKLHAAVSLDVTYYSLDSGEFWSPGLISQAWESIATSADGSKVVVVASGAQIYVSSNSGVSYAAVNSTSTWRTVASSADGTRLIAADNDGHIDTSSNSGTTWSRQTFARLWRGVASSSTGSTLVAVPSANPIKVSLDSGATWTDRESSRNWSAVACSADGTKMVAVVDGGFIYTSANSGTTWTQRESSRQWRSVSSSADGTVMAAVATNQRIYISLDSGVTWVARENFRNWSAITVLANGSRFIAAEQGGQIYISPQINSTFGPTGGAAGKPGSSIELVYLGGGRFLNIGINGTAVLY